MNNAFGPESGFMSFFTKAVDALILAILWSICCIPVFTAGAASCALYYAYHRSVRQDGGRVCRTFFKAFALNFKQATGIWLVMFLYLTLSAITCYLLFVTGGSIPMASAALAMGFVVMAFGVIWCIYLFAYGARFENKASVVLKNSAVLAVANLPRSVLLLLIFAAAVALVLYKPAMLAPAVAVYIWIANGILEQVFRRIMTEDALRSEKEFDS